MNEMLVPKLNDIDLVQHLGHKMEVIRQKELIPLMASLDPDSLRELAKAIGRVVSRTWITGA